MSEIVCAHKWHAWSAWDFELKENKTFEKCTRCDTSRRAGEPEPRVVIARIE